MPIDINKLRAEKGGDPEAVRASEQKRYRNSDTVGNAVELDQQWRKDMFALDKLREELGKIQKEITQKKKASKGKDPCTEELVRKAEGEKKIQEQEKLVAEVAKSRDAAVHSIGNIILPDVPVGNDEDNNEVYKKWGQPRQILVDGKTPGHLYHHQIMYMLGAMDQERGINIVGHRGYFLRGVGVLLNMALINYGMSLLVKKGYTALQPPFFMKKDIMAETAELGDFDEQLYKVSENSQQKKEEKGLKENDGEYYLIATSEQPISAYHRKEWIDEDQLPLRYAGISTCFRKEAGSHGKETWGLYRIHQFEKLEQFCITTPEESVAMHEHMLDMAEEFYQSLDLPYRVVKIVSGALNDAAAKKYDLEAWFPGYNMYKELVSCSNCTDYQARAMETRCGHVKQGEREKRYVHMLNSTLCATERAMCCIVENYQEEEGVRVPRVLVPFMHGMEFLPYVKPVPKNPDEGKKAEKK
ncbi:seryl-tRNA synthetase, cytoplasmic, putative [Perkinsus marinus ATCC 50983]|uniref:serine--tRNA ligase n=1 Tax=Perkinsus marinus (strain ATCC 50983 / TXsc) TaxID=423536 RepID=C5K7F7_PERM5|nr:seryl-tRNA synthetase, cytoplasmic, putative [Perkinsus marinus ATCC 50983]EER19492.1 seryl-tRNA synthetase, cytoplasmic, putative [Perkinsus marinus ATCC 50983]|eukprot:XP_002787696.1 seryl-tRNA synthetase, cytoplasmic, putative [Perkinsus marinus ATCC 50983]